MGINSIIRAFQRLRSAVFEVVLQLRAKQNSSKQLAQSAGNVYKSDDWFWVINAYDKNVGGYPVEIYRVVLWEKSSEGVIGLISPELSGNILEAPPPVCGQYKHMDDLSNAERNALLRQRDDFRRGTEGYINPVPSVPTSFSKENETIFSLAHRLLNRAPYLAGIENDEEYRAAESLRDKVFAEDYDENKLLICALNRSIHDWKQRIDAACG